MEDQLVSFQTAKIAKEKGFDWECDHFGVGGFPTRDLLVRTYQSDPDFYEYPTQSLLQKWLRQVHNIIVYVKPKNHHFEVEYSYPNKFGVHFPAKGSECFSVGKYHSWEEALEQGLQNALIILEEEDGTTTS